MSETISVSITSYTTDSPTVFVKWKIVKEENTVYFLHLSFFSLSHLVVRSVAGFLRSAINSDIDDDHDSIVVVPSWVNTKYTLFFVLFFVLSFSLLMIMFLIFSSFSTFLDFIFVYFYLFLFSAAIE